MLSLVTFSPLIGVAAILLLRGRTDDRSARATRWIALATTLFTLALSGLMLAQFDRSTASYQFVERLPLFGGFEYAMGVDGISILFVVLTAFLMPLCIIASWAIRERVAEYMIAFLVLETLVIGVFTALDMLLFYLFFEGGLIPMFLIIGIWGGKNRIYAAYKFFLYTLLGSILMLGAMLYMVGVAGTSSIPELAAYDFGRTEQLWLFAAFFASFAVKDADVACAHLAARTRTSRRRPRVR
jgi:NADH-quinone oxidoreductase subunit M